jgi:hypothetical protein
MPCTQRREIRCWIAGVTIMASGLVACATSAVQRRAPSGTKPCPNMFVRYLEAAQLQAEDDGQRATIRRALHDIITLDAAELETARYQDYAGSPARWSLLRLLAAYFVPGPDWREDVRRGCCHMSESCIWRDLATSEARALAKARLESLLPPSSSMPSVGPLRPVCEEGTRLDEQSWFDGECASTWLVERKCVDEAGVAQGPYVMIGVDGVFETGRYRNGRAERDAGSTRGFARSSGHYQLRYLNGKKMLEGELRVGQQHGLWSFWYPNGRLRETIPFRDGAYHGKWRTWAPDGSLIAVQRFDDGKPGDFEVAPNPHSGPCPNELWHSNLPGGKWRIGR